VIKRLQELCFMKTNTKFFSMCAAAALLAAGSITSEVAYGQGASNRGGGAAQSQRPSTAQRPTNPGSQAAGRIPQQAQDRIPQQAKDRAPPFGGSRPDAAQKGLEKAAENASDRAKEVAPPLGGSLPAEAQEGLAKAAGNAPEQARNAAAPLQGSEPAGEEAPASE
jgi:hypothetical protein